MYFHKGKGPTDGRNKYPKKEKLRFVKVKIFINRQKALFLDHDKNILRNMHLESLNFQLNKFSKKKIYAKYKINFEFITF